MLGVLGALVVVALVGACSGANILVMLPLPFHSHTNAYLPVIRGLVERGHNVTMVSSFPFKKPIPNLYEIRVQFELPQQEAIKIGDIVDSSVFAKYLFPFILMTAPLRIMDDLLTNDVVQRVIQDKDSHYDLILLETFFMQELFVALGHKYNAPIINLNPIEPMTIASYYTGSPNPYSYVPRKLTTFGSNRMTFIERVFNTIGTLIELTVAHVYYLPQMEGYMRKYFKYEGSNSLPPLTEMLRNTSLTLCDTHKALNWPRSFHENVIMFGGLTVNQSFANLESLDNIPKDLKKFIDEAPEGVVYFSTGSHMNSSGLKPNTIEALINAFSKLKQRVLWKWNGGPMTNKPDNVMLQDWFPQNQILNHPKCEVFITHGGSHSVLESVYFGTPIIGIPIAADQPLNLQVAAEKGVGIVLTFPGITQDYMLLVKAVETITNTPSYKENTLKMSAILKDTPMPTLDYALYWVEYVLRHDGAKHLRPSSVDLYFHQYLLLDVTLFLIAVIALDIWLTVALCKKFICRKSAEKVSRKGGKQE